MRRNGTKCYPLATTHMHKDIYTHVCTHMFLRTYTVYSFVKFCIYLKTRCCCVTQGGFDIMVLLPLPPKC